MRFYTTGFWVSSLGSWQDDLLHKLCCGMGWSGDGLTGTVPWGIRDSGPSMQKLRFFKMILFGWFWIIFGWFWMIFGWFWMMFGWFWMILEVPAWFFECALRESDCWKYLEVSEISRWFRWTQVAPRMMGCLDHPAVQPWHHRWGENTVNHRGSWQFWDVWMIKKDSAWKTSNYTRWSSMFENEDPQHLLSFHEVFDGLCRVGFVTNLSVDCSWSKYFVQ